MRSERHESVLPVAPLMRWLVLVVFIGLLGLCYVQMKIRLTAAGNEQRELERELLQMGEKNQVLQSQVTRLSSRAALQARMEEGMIRMVPIPDTQVVRLRAVETLEGIARFDAPDGGAETEVRQ